jgi:succinate dehydrogenase/fumarate reductase-like Fe-S protein
MRREICGECGAPINDDGTCDCTELLKRGWRLCAKGQQTTQWCAMADCEG